MNEPCEGCEWKSWLNLPTYVKQGCPYKGNCAKESKYLGYQDGLAKGSWNVVQRMKDKACGGLAYDSDWDDMALEMALWLKQSGIPEPQGKE
jgi:hypothetical protein